MLLTIALPLVCLPLCHLPRFALDLWPIDGLHGLSTPSPVSPTPHHTLHANRSSTLRSAGKSSSRRPGKPTPRRRSTTPSPSRTVSVGVGCAGGVLRGGCSSARQDGGSCGSAVLVSVTGPARPRTTSCWSSALSGRRHTRAASPTPPSCCPQLTLPSYHRPRGPQVRPREALRVVGEGISWYIDHTLPWEMQWLYLDVEVGVLPAGWPSACTLSVPYCDRASVGSISVACSSTR